MAVFRKMTLTDEQCQTIKYAITRESLIINAFAGSGKSFILAAIANVFKSANLRCLYIVFNQSAVKSAKKNMPSNTICKTMHSLAYGDIGYKFHHRLGSYFNKYEISNNRSLIGSAIYFNDDYTLKSDYIFRTITRFCYSNDDFIKTKHVYKTDVVKMHPGVSESFIRACIKDLIKSAQKVWNELKRDACTYTITHDFYLKIWCMMKPILRYDVIMVDEAQDLNPVFKDVIEMNAESTQVICVGDKYQQIYAWRGAVDFMDTFNASNNAIISQSFRWGQDIGDLSNAILNTYSNADVNIKGFDRLNTKISMISNIPNAILTRTNSGLFTALKQYIGRCKINILGGVTETIKLIRSLDMLYKGKKTKHPDLVMFKSWNDLHMFLDESKESNNLTPMVKLFEQYGSYHIIDLLNQCKSKNPDLIISTAHKAKGAEWGNVVLWNDFFEPEWNKDYQRLEYGNQETKLLYVACTRAQKQLDISRCNAANMIFKNNR